MTSISSANKILQLAWFRILGSGTLTLSMWLITDAIRR